MDFKDFYDDYWRKKGDEVDYSRLDLVVERINPGEKVLEVGGEIGLLAERIREKGAQVSLTDISKIALSRAGKKGVKETFQVDLDEEPLPFEDNAFDAVVSCSSIEHIFYPQKMIHECARVLKPGGRFMLMAPNIGHWRFRVWLVLGRFPYIKDTPTDELHIRFMTLYEAKKMCSQHGLETELTDGNAGLWSTGLYPSVFRIGYVRSLYKLLARNYPSLFARDFILICRKIG
jgi:ubiquinone/menaquinone biosynthesis C-methylase UbiE